MRATNRTVTRWIAVGLIISLLSFSEGFASPFPDSRPCLGERDWLDSVQWVWATHPTGLAAPIAPLEGVHGNDPSPLTLLTFARVGVALISRSAATSALTTPDIAINARDLLVEHDVEQGAGLLSLVQAHRTGDDTLAQESASLVDAATDVGKEASLELQRVLERCGGYDVWQLASVTDCIDAMAGMSGPWGDYVTNAVPALAAFASYPAAQLWELPEADVLEQTREHIAQYAALPVPRGAEAMDAAVHKLIARDLEVLDHADTGQWQPVVATAEATHAILTELEQARKAMVEPCALRVHAATLPCPTRGPAWKWRTSAGC